MKNHIKRFGLLDYDYDKVVEYINDYAKKNKVEPISIATIIRETYQHPNSVLVVFSPERSRGEEQIS